MDRNKFWTGRRSSSSPIARYSATFGGQCTPSMPTNLPELKRTRQIARLQN